MNKQSTDREMQEAYLISLLQELSTDDKIELIDFMNWLTETPHTDEEAEAEIQRRMAA